LKLFDKLNTTDYMANNISIGDQTPAGTAFGSELTTASTLSDHDATGKRLPSGTTIFNQDSSFFTGLWGGGKPFPETFATQGSSYHGLNLDQLREVSLLHELFHINDVGGAYNDDTPDGELNLQHSKAINKLIREKCGFPSSFGYDAFGPSTSRSGSLYGTALSDGGAYVLNRRDGWSYDEDGNVTLDSSYHQTFDGASQYTHAVATQLVGDGSTQWPETPELEITQAYDGNGQ
jgi:hypothetical protein